jgi:hypothetical protein
VRFATGAGCDHRDSGRPGQDFVSVWNPEEEVPHKPIANQNQGGRAASAPSLRVNGHRRRAPLLSPILTKALSELAASEGLPLPALVAVLINEALTRRLRSQP